MYLPTWEPHIADVILKIVETNRKIGQKRTTMVGVVGMPGSGKTTSSNILASLLEGTYHIPTIVIPMDGYHFSIEQLKSMENSAEMIYRRGAPETFNADALRRDLLKIQNEEENVVSIPGFDHEIGDPTPNQHIFERKKHEVVIVEGLYLLYEDERLGWHGIKVS